MVDLKSRISFARSKLLRRASAAPGVPAKPATPTHEQQSSPRFPPTPASAQAALQTTTPTIRRDTEDSSPERQLVIELPKHAAESRPPRPGLIEVPPSKRSDSLASRDLQSLDSSIVDVPEPSPLSKPALHVEQPTPEPSPAGVQGARDRQPPGSYPQSPPAASRPVEGFTRKQSLLSSSNAEAGRRLLQSEPRSIAADLVEEDYFSGGPATLSANMLHRKIWVKRPGASATLVQIREDDLVDDVRDMVLKKYANSLGRSFDSPDVTLRIVPRDLNTAGKNVERTLGPEEEMCRTLDAYFPNGQNVHEALLIDVPQRRTPKPSPRTHHNHHSYYLEDSSRPHENGGDYFPPMPVGVPSPAALTTASHDSRSSHPERAMSVLNTGQVPLLPSPGGANRRLHHHRPKYARQHTASPTTAAHAAAVKAVQEGNRPRLDSTASDSVTPRPHNHIVSTAHVAPAPPPLPTPPAPEAPPTNQQISTPPTPRVSSPRPPKNRRRPVKPSQKTSDPKAANPLLPAGLLDASVPPINVLLVEDNMINLKLLEAFMKRLKVRWQTALNGREAVDKWRMGGFHLVLMDIQLPIMSGLEATKEIRRLEGVNKIGVFSSVGENGVEEKGQVNGTSDEKREPSGGGDQQSDQLGEIRSLFKSPVIIVALTASSLQSDRHEALAAGCNDFLTKPVNFVWLERKVKEWGCMQALIDFDGWRKWKDFAASPTKKITNGAPKAKATQNGGITDGS